MSTAPYILDILSCGGEVILWRLVEPTATLDDKVRHRSLKIAFEISGIRNSYETNFGYSLHHVNLLIKKELFINKTGICHYAVWRKVKMEPAYVHVLNINLYTCVFMLEHCRRHDYY